MDKLTKVRLSRILNIVGKIIFVLWLVFVVFSGDEESYNNQEKSCFLRGNLPSLDSRLEVVNIDLNRANDDRND
ncbi:MAG: hypothetical protein JW734_02155 [Candidatus Omnitrophica bacterium]|nr:hypothetical protein [Candidatus Omnitrophota bacterium]